MSEPTQDINYEIIRDSKYFDSAWYKLANPDVANSCDDPIAHYLEYGWKEGRAPSPNFDGKWYLEHYPDVAESGANPLVHFLCHGMQEGRFPLSELAFDVTIESKETDDTRESELQEDFETVDQSGMFDPTYYASTNPDVPSSGGEPLWHYIRDGWREGRRPSVFFDSAWYLREYTDVAKAEVNPLVHFIREGQPEGRSPHALFDINWYVQKSELKGFADQATYQRYLKVDLAKGVPPIPELAHIYSCSTKQGDAFIDFYAQFVLTSNDWLERVGRRKFVILLALFSPFATVSESVAAQGLDILDKLLYVLREGMFADLDIGPLFDCAFYREACRQRGKELSVGCSALLDFLIDGFDQRIVPTKAFDEAWYCITNRDIDENFIWPYEHFVRWGIFEGRKAKATFDIVLAPQFSTKEQDVDRNLYRWKAFFAANSVSSDDQFASYFFYKRKIDHILSATITAEIARRLVKIEPAIGDIADIKEVLVPPLFDYRETARKALRERIGAKHYETIICVPWIRTGGADLVSCQLSEAILKIARQKSILILRTDQPHFERPDWVPVGVDVADVSDVFSTVEPIHSQLLLYGLLLGLAPQRVINVNSRLCWDTFVRFGARLNNAINLYSYLFCWDRTPTGALVGYPSEYFPETAHLLAATFTDTVYLREQLREIYNLPDTVASKVVPLFSPSRGIRPDVVAAEQSALRHRGRERARVLWAGRLDRQKRFDLVQDIAHQMPDVDFICWGKSLLDAGPDLTHSPQNLLLHDSFRTYDELPLNDSDLWLFTSEWEGMPTILIELGLQGISIVASSVGGVPELIDNETGWPVEDFSNVQAYVDAIREALGNPAERIQRAKRLQDRASNRHSMDSYVTQLKDIFDRERLK
ncbi:glycosyltransferase family 4 protein [Caballeronia terrestris]|uniref:glycosyltransferase family 4 protein n=1 Tax=Caballeronia terrestris TaxID=1226301 RepID=UPI001F27B3AB|nr:glycosyltransferase family 4 protein [Caballeronia terrestris]